MERITPWKSTLEEYHWHKEKWSMYKSPMVLMKWIKGGWLAAVRFEWCIVVLSRLLPYGPLAGGTLSGKYLDEKKPYKSRHTMFPGIDGPFAAHGCI